MEKTDFVSLHSSLFSLYGFKFNQSELLFEKDCEHGKQLIFVYFIERNLEYFLEYQLCVRINAVEELINRYLPTQPNYVEKSLTLHKTPDNLGNFYSNKFTYSEDTQFSEAILQAKNFFVNAGFKWLNKMSTPLILEQEFLHHKEKPFDSNNLVESAFRSLALSRLYNPTDYPILRQSFMEKLDFQEMTPFTIASFLQFVDHLDKDKLEIN